MRILIASLIAVLAITATARATDPLELLNPHWDFGRPSDADASLQQSGSDLDITVNKPSDPFWKVIVTQTVTTDLPADHILRLSFRAKSSTHNTMRAVVEHAIAPYAAIALVTPTLGPDWQRFQIEGNSPGYGPAGVGVRFQIGQQAGNIQIADVHFTDLGLDPAIVSARAAIEPAAIAARIEKYRKRTLELHVIDFAGRPLPNVHVEVMQTRHAFLFGCNLFGLDVHATDEMQIKYQQCFAELFNYATLPFYWGGYEKTPGNTQEKRLRELATWCRDHRITTKGHPLIYQLVYPNWAPKDPVEAVPLLHARVTDLINRYDGLINIWDVMNEANTAHIYPTTGVGAWVIRDGAPQAVGTALQWARAANPTGNETFLYNDYDRTAQNLGLLQWLADHHQLPDVIGMQSHMHEANWRPDEIWAVAERFARFGRPIHFTETTIVSAEHRSIPNAPGPDATDWKTTPAGEKEQAAYIVQFYSILFSHPSLRAITWWDLSDRHAWLGAPAGLLREDNSPKPAYDALMQLIHHDWWTHEQLLSDSNGNCPARVFCGDYSIILTDDAGHRLEKTITVPLSDAATESNVKVEVKL